MTARPVVIVGGGISGLVLARELERRGLEWLLFEARPAFGGNIRTARHDGFSYDVGPDSFLRAKPEALQLCEELGLHDELIEPSQSAVYVARDGALHAMPDGLSLGVPTRFGALLDTPLLSDLGKARACLEPFVRSKHVEGESILSFMTRRLGREMAETLAAPLLAGVYAGAAERLDMQACFPQLVAFERQYGSLFAGFTQGRSLLRALRTAPGPRPSAFVTLAGGLSRLIERLASELPRERLLVDSPVSSLSVESDGVRVRVGQREILARHVVISGAPRFAERLLRTAAPRAAEALGTIRGAATATVFFGLRQAQLAQEWVGSGFIVPPGEGDVLAATWVSSKWAGRAPSGHALVRAFLGGARSVGGNVIEQSDEQLAATAFRELTRLMGDLGEPTFSRVYRYEEGSPQPELGHGERLAAIRDATAALPWLSLTGPGYGAVGTPDCIGAARALGRSLEGMAPSGG